MGMLSCPPVTTACTGARPTIHRNCLGTEAGIDPPPIPNFHSSIETSILLPKRAVGPSSNPEINAPTRPKSLAGTGALTFATISKVIRAAVSMDSGQPVNEELHSGAGSVGTGPKESS
ncbi:hypothetical protein NDU88_006233 [Pleurodeles waltl]|uniref:Uncharacterized protein n=1 Tax=Pleurodeles waltl TaxID=8319 RepID=A0AAV7PL81_PLEWA|nr:hypothetical protein NDU88_006233 [Pleurodeles waltl]